MKKKSGNRLKTTQKIKEKYTVKSKKKSKDDKQNWKNAKENIPTVLYTVAFILILKTIFLWH